MGVSHMMQAPFPPKCSWFSAFSENNDPIIVFLLCLQFQSLLATSVSALRPPFALTLRVGDEVSHLNPTPVCPPSVSKSRYMNLRFPSCAFGCCEMLYDPIVSLSAILLPATFSFVVNVLFLCFCVLQIITGDGPERGAGQRFVFRRARLSRSVVELRAGG